MFVLIVIVLIMAVRSLPILMTVGKRVFGLMVVLRMLMFTGMIVVRVMLAVLWRMSLRSIMFHSCAYPSIARKSAGACCRGNNGRAHSPVTTNVTTPLSTIAGTRPNHAAIKPDSKPPNSFDAR
jgi:hypothetical protein